MNCFIFRFRICIRLSILTRTHALWNAGKRKQKDISIFLSSLKSSQVTASTQACSVAISTSNSDPRTRVNESTALYQFLPTSLRNSSLVFAFSRKQPLIQLVVVLAPVFWTPRITIHRWLASTTTATPCGWRISNMASDTCFVSRSWSCSRRENISTMRAIFDSPMTRPSGIYPMCICQYCQFQISRSARAARSKGSYLPRERHKVMLTQRRKLDISHDHQLLMIFFENSPVDNLAQDLLVAFGEEQHRLRESLRCAEKAFSARIFAHAFQHRFYGAR